MNTCSETSRHSTCSQSLPAHLKGNIAHQFNKETKHNYWRNCLLSVFLVPTNNIQIRYTF